jgi:crotonobetainyl-CoA:carnitine CoA-transferase CaiB-like acyl-CoA transferase
MFAFLGASLRGRGDHVDVNGVRVALTSIDTKSLMMCAYQYTGHLYSREESGYGPVVCKDGYVGGFDGTAASKSFFPGWAQMLELDKETREEWGRYATDPEKMAEFSAIFLIPWLLEHTQKEIVEKGQRAGIFATPYHTIETLLNDPHFRERGFWEEVDHPVMGKLTCPGPPFRIGGESWQFRRPAPLLGQHNEEIYAEHGYSKDDLVHLRQAGVI